MGINIGQFLTPYPDFGNEAGALSAMTNALGQLGHNRVAREGMAQQQKQFEDSQRQQSDQFGQTAWANMMNNRLAQATPLWQQHATLVAEGTQESLLAAKEIEAALSNLGFSYSPQGGGDASGGVSDPGKYAGPPVAQPNEGEDFHSFYARVTGEAPAALPTRFDDPRLGPIPEEQRRAAEETGGGNLLPGAAQAPPPASKEKKRDRIIYGTKPAPQMAAPSAVAPTASSTTGQVSPKEAKKTALEAMAELAAAKRAAPSIANQVGIAARQRGQDIPQLSPNAGPEPATDMPEEVRQAAQEENARIYGPIFRSAPAMLPPPGTQPEPQTPSPAQPNLSAGQLTRADEKAAGLSATGAAVRYMAPKESAPMRPTSASVLASPSVQRMSASAQTAPMPPASATPPGEGLARPASSFQTPAEIPAHLRPSDIIDTMTGRKIGESHPEIAYRLSTEKTRRMAEAFAAGTDPEFRPLIEGLVARAKTPAELEGLMKILGSPEVMHLIGERAARSAAYAKAQKGSGRADTLDYMSGVTLFEKSLTDQSLKNYTESWRNFKEAAEMLDSGNPIATVAVSRGVAKAMNGPGVMTDQDAQAPKELLPWKDKIIAWVQGRAVGDLPDNIKQLFGDYLKRKANWLESEVNRSYQDFVGMMRDYGPPSGQAYRAAVGQAKQFYSKFGRFNPADFNMTPQGQTSRSGGGESVSGQRRGAGASVAQVRKDLGGL